MGWLAGRDLTKVSLPELLYMGWQNHGLRYLGQGWFTGAVLTRNIRESVLVEKVLKHFRQKDIDIDGAALHVAKTSGHTVGPNMTNAEKANLIDLLAQHILAPLQTNKEVESEMLDLRRQLEEAQITIGKLQSKQAPLPEPHQDEKDDEPTLHQLASLRGRRTRQQLPRPKSIPQRATKRQLPSSKPILQRNHILPLFQIPFRVWLPMFQRNPRRYSASFLCPHPPRKDSPSGWAVCLWSPKLRIAYKILSRQWTMYSNKWARTMCRHSQMLRQNTVAQCAWLGRCQIQSWWSFCWLPLNSWNDIIPTSNQPLNSGASKLVMLSTCCPYAHIFCSYFWLSTDCCIYPLHHSLVKFASLEPIHCFQNFLDKQVQKVPSYPLDLARILQEKDAVCVPTCWNSNNSTTSFCRWLPVCG